MWYIATSVFLRTVRHHGDEADPTMLGTDVSYSDDDIQPTAVGPLRLPAENPNAKSSGATKTSESSYSKPSGNVQTF